MRERTSAFKIAGPFVSGTEAAFAVVQFATEIGQIFVAQQLTTLGLFTTRLGVGLVIERYTKGKGRVHDFQRFKRGGFGATPKEVRKSPRDAGPEL
jgi:hypothetical protein